MVAFRRNEVSGDIYDTAARSGSAADGCTVNQSCADQGQGGTNINSAEPDRDGPLLTDSTPPHVPQPPNGGGGSNGPGGNQVIPSPHQFWRKFDVREWITASAAAAAAFAAITSCFIAFWTYKQLDAQRIIMSRQLDEMHLGGIDTHNLAIAAQSEAQTLKGQFNITTIQLKPKMALLFKQPTEIIQDGVNGYLITPIWGNAGTTSAIKFWGWDKSKIFSNEDSKFDFLRIPQREVSHPVKDTINPDQETLQRSIFFSHSDLENIVMRKYIFIIYGYIEYAEELPGKKMHHIHWCYRAAPVQKYGGYVFSYIRYKPECNTAD